MIAKPLPDPDPDPNAWRRFERAVDVVFHTPPKHREAKAKPESSPAVTRSSKARP